VKQKVICNFIFKLQMKEELQGLIDTRLNNPQEQLDVCDFEALIYFIFFLNFIILFSIIFVNKL